MDNKQITLIERFKEIADRKPDAIAVKDKKQIVTYRQLDMWSDHIASAILKRVTYCDEKCFIGIYAQRTVLLPAMYLGVWKAGFAYLPMDPAHVAARQASIINDCAPALILTDTEAVPPVIGDTAYLYIQGESMTDTPDFVVQPPCRYAYIIYTSGTTGTPKGVPILQRSLDNLVDARQDFIPAAENETELCYASISFDASVWEIFPALLTGTSIYIADDEERHNPNALVQIMEEQQISVATIPPVMLSILPYRHLPRLRYLVVAGEKCPEATIRKWQKTCKVINAYGPTEATVCATACILNENSHPNDIGTALRNMSCHILDEHLKPVATGEKGELYIGGVQLTEGYWHGKQANESFVSLTDVADGARLYATGDIVYANNEGHLVFCGRKEKDSQVKIHGYRVELGEVQTVIERFPHVNAAVIETQGQDSNATMRAYIATDDHNLDIKQLRDYLAKELPSFMIPAILFPVQTIPYNLHGKTDFEQLHRLYQNSVESQTYGDEQFDDIERQIAKMWRKVTGSNAPISRSTHFYEFGGDSVTTILMSMEIETEFKIELALDDVFTHLRFEELAQLIRQAKPSETQRKIRTGQRTKLPIPRHLHDLFMHCCLSDETSQAYNLAVFVPFDKNLNTDLLLKAWNLLRITQDALRFMFTITDFGQPELWLQPFDCELSIPLIEAKDEEMWNDCNQRISTIIPLDRLCYTVLYHREDGSYLFALFIHHLISDGWTANIIKQQLTDIYASLVSNEQILLPNLSYNYIDYAIDKTRKEEQDIQEFSSYWRDYLTDVADLQFPSTKSAVSPDYTARYIYDELPAAASIQLQSICNENHVTMFSLFSAAYLVTLSRFCRQDNFVIGYPSAGRSSNLCSDVIGYYVHTLPLRYHAEYQQLSSIELCRQLQHDILQGESHLLSLSSIISSMDMPSSMSDSPLIQTILTVEEAGLENQHLHNKYAHFPLTLLVIKDLNSLKLQWMYRHVLFSADHIKDLSHCLVNLLVRIAHHPHMPMAEMSLASDEEIAKMKTANTIYPFVTPKENIIDLFKAQVRTSRHPWILKDAHSQLSFQDFDQQSDSLAERLLRQVPVHAATGLFMYRSVKAIVAMMGILKAGHMYVPMDQTYPDERLKTMILDSGMKCIVCNRELTDSLRRLNLSPEVNIIIFEECMEKPWPLTLQPQPIDSQTPAYMIYTSGTTGKPKGVVINHGNVTSFVTIGVRDRFLPSPDDIVLQYCSYLFDVSVNDIFTTILHGARLVCIDEEERRDPHRLFNILENEKVTHAYIAPAFLLACNKEATSALRTLIVGGEAPAQTLVDRYTPHLNMINGYGPTENTVFSTSHNYNQTHIYAANCIGKALTGVTCYVLDHSHLPVPAGCPGELFLGGLQLSPGYHKRPELNKERFISNPFITSQDALRNQNTRIYATGDIVVQDTNGNIFYLGRKDFQVKIRGFRVELHEIESILTKHPDVSQCIVQVRRHNVTDQLAAYVISPNPDLEPHQLREFLTPYLPSYMIPDSWYIAPSLPLNSSGKIDRRHLPESTLLPSQASDEECTEEETKTKTLVSRITDIPAEAIKLDDDLFNDHGINSLHVLELTHQLSQRGYNIHPTDLYQQRSIRKLAAYLSSDECTKGLTDKQIDERICFFATPDDPNKPILVVAAGYPHYEWFYGEFHRQFKESYTILVLETPNELYALRPDLPPTCDAMIDEYIRLLRPVLERRTIAGVTGLCFGGDTALKLAVRLNQYNLAKPAAFVIDGYACRSEYSDWTLVEQEGISMELIVKRNEVVSQLSKTMIHEYYPGTTYLFRATVFADEPGQSKKRGEELFPKNCANWARIQPDLHVVLMDYVHMDLVVHPDSVKRIKNHIDAELLKQSPLAP